MNRAMLLVLSVVALAFTAAPASADLGSVTGAATAVTTTTATLEGTVDPDGVDTTYHFDYGTDESYGYATPESTPPLTGSGAQAATADISDLQPGTTYHYRLVAASADSSSVGQDMTFTTSPLPPAVPAVTTGAASTTDGEIARLTGTVNPQRADTSYHFEYGATTAYGSSTPTVNLGHGDTSVAVARYINGLASGTTYHFRLKAANAVGSTSGPDRTFTTRVSTAGEAEDGGAEGSGGIPGRGFLPDNRGWEMASPQDKNGNDIIPDYGFGRASVAGDAVAFSSVGAFADAGSLANIGTYLARRTAGGWTTHSVVPRQDQNGRLTAVLALQGFSRDLSVSVLAAADPQLTGAAQPNTANLWLRDTATGQASLLTSRGAPLGTLLAGRFSPGSFVGASTDFTHVVFESSLKLTPDAPVDNPTGQGANGTNIYEFHAGAVRLVSILPDGSPAPGAYSGSVDIQGGGAASGQYTQGTHVVSADGSRIVWTDVSTGQLYVRLGGTTTVQVSRSQRSAPDPEGARPATFRGATPDGSKIFFTSSEKLTDDSTASTAAAGAEDLYSYDLASEELVDLSVSAAPASVLGVIGASDDGATVYFAANGNLTPDSNVVPDVFDPDGAVATRPKVYVSHDGVVRYVATLATQFESSPEGASWGVSPNLSGSESQARVSANGRYLLLKSAVHLTKEAAGEYETGAPQLFRFDLDAVAAPIVCVSCAPGSDAPTHEAFISRVGQFPSSAASVLPHALLGDGRVLFSTAEALRPSDRNGKSDVYMWGPSGPRLISSGTASSDAVFVDASDDAQDVFIATRDRLTGWDTDANIDIYDARVDGGFPDPVAPPAACVADACQGPQTGAAAPPPVASLNLVGAGDATAPRRPPLTSTSAVVSANKSVHGTAFSIAVKVPGKGRITASGSGLKTAKRTATRPTTYHLQISLTDKAKRTLARRATLRVSVRVTFAPSAGSATAKTLRVTLKRPQGGGASSRHVARQASVPSSTSRKAR